MSAQWVRDPKTFAGGLWLHRDPIARVWIQSAAATSSVRSMAINSIADQKDSWMTRSMSALGVLWPRRPIVSDIRCCSFRSGRMNGAAERQCRSGVWARMIPRMWSAFPGNDGEVDFDVSVFRKTAVTLPPSPEVNVRTTSKPALRPSAAKVASLKL